MKKDYNVEVTATQSGKKVKEHFVVNTESREHAEAYIRHHAKGMGLTKLKFVHITTQ